LRNFDHLRLDQVETSIGCFWLFLDHKTNHFKRAALLVP
jgi:hypothetical protein